MDETRNRDLLSLMNTRLLARNSFLNLAGNIVPLAAAIVVIPHLVKGLGTERFGVLSLVWIVIGYFGLFDLGIGRATTKIVSEQIAQERIELLHDTIWTSLATLTCFGLLGGIVLAALNGTLVVHVLQIPSSLQQETFGAFYLLAASIPFVLASAGVRGVLEAHRRFGVINAIKIPVGVASIALPLLVLPYSHSLMHIAAALLVCRALDLIANLLACHMALSGFGRPRRPQAEQFKRLLGFGGWLTVTNLVGPLMTYLDRFIVGGILTMSAVTYYATPYDVVTKQGIVPASLLGVVFPALSGYAAIDTRSFVSLYERSATYLVAIMTPAALVLVVLAGPLLNLWLGQEFVEKSTVVVQLLAIGVFLNAVAQVPYAAIQALGRPDITAKLHVVELPFYLCLLWISVMQLGITGAALAWLVRVMLDAGVLFWLPSRMLPANSTRTGYLAAVVACLTAILAASAGLTSTVITGVVPRLVLLLCGMAVTAVLLRRLFSHMKPDGASYPCFTEPPSTTETDKDGRQKKVVSHV